MNAIETSSNAPRHSQLRGAVGQNALSTKIQSRHLEQLAIVYVRQSSTRQVQENIESTQLQYQLVDRAELLGWPRGRIIVIDDDLGLSGRSIEGRVGFQRLLAEVGLDHVGIVLGIEMSRLARSCRDWHQLLELCALFGTLLGDADGVYQPRDHNDRLLLGLKGTMSEAELHVLQGRLDAGKRNKARRGEYYNHAPIGYMRSRDALIKEPDDQSREVVQLVFDKFAELGSCSGVLQWLQREQIQLGFRDHRGPERGELQWRPPNSATLLCMLHHPIYAGAYVYGRRACDPRRRVAGKPGSGRKWADPQDWEVLIHDALPAYISWQQWEKNQAKLKENSTHWSNGAARGKGLLAGRVVCGRCGHKMSISYAGKTKARFTCDASRNHLGVSQCQAMNARPLETLVEQQLLIAIQPVSLELSIQAAESVEADRQRAEKHHQQSVQRANYQADTARRRFVAVDPGNRLVAAELERLWEKALQSQREAEEELDRFRQRQPSKLTAEQRELIHSLASSIPALWRAETTSGTDRQIILRALIEKIVVEVIGSSERVAITIHWTGGFESHYEIRRAVGRFDKLEAASEIWQCIKQLRDQGYSIPKIAEQLNQDGYHSASGGDFTVPIVSQLLRKLGPKSGTDDEVSTTSNNWRLSALAMRLGVKDSTLNTWRRRGWVQAQQIGSRWMYWADNRELDRLTELSTKGGSKFKATPAKLTTPRSSPPKPSQT